MNTFVKLIRSVGAAPASAAALAKRQSKDEKKKANESKIQSIRTQIGASIGNAFPSTPTERKKGGKRHHSTDDGSISSMDDSLGSSISSRRRKQAVTAYPMTILQLMSLRCGNTLNLLSIKFHKWFAK
mmetsp:Transcript_20601/g.47381  ORF Transcript_20601/g.47381 Transcript_20601/m.47381 type:complete len:128 (+) Transcript_20601:244-627(+)